MFSLPAIAFWWFGVSYRISTAWESLLERFGFSSRGRWRVIAYPLSPTTQYPVWWPFGRASEQLMPLKNDTLNTFLDSMRDMYLRQQWFTMTSDGYEIVRSPFQFGPTVPPRTLPAPFGSDVFAVVTAGPAFEVVLELPTFSKYSHILFRDHLKILLGKTKLPDDFCSTYQVFVEIEEVNFVLDCSTMLILHNKTATKVRVSDQT